MRRQLRASGGIMNARQGYGVGSWVKEKIRKIIPNELADLAVKAAPFVAPFYPGAAAAMRGIGRFDQRGSIGDAVRQAGATYAFGKVANKGLSSIQTGAGGTAGNRFTSPLGTDTGFKLGTKATDPTGIDNARGGKIANTKNITQEDGIMKRTTDKLFSKVPFGEKLNQTVKEKLLVSFISLKIRDDIKYPEITKNISTPINPPLK